jgi:TM2 domain-containing membrane protein YozV
MSEEIIEEKPKSKNIAFVLWLFLGLAGAHKFYMGKIGMGIAYIFTLGFVGIGWILDIFTLFAKVDAYNGLMSDEDASLLASFKKIWGGLIKIQSISRGIQAATGATYTCKYCGRTVAVGAEGRCYKSGDGSHHRY